MGKLISFNCLTFITFKPQQKQRSTEVKSPQEKKRSFPRPSMRKTKTDLAGYLF